MHTQHSCRSAYSLCGTMFVTVHQSAQGSECTIWQCNSQTSHCAVSLLVSCVCRACKASCRRLHGTAATTATAHQLGSRRAHQIATAAPAATCRWRPQHRSSVRCACALASCCRWRTHGAHTVVVAAGLTWGPRVRIRIGTEPNMPHIEAVCNHAAAG